MNCNKTIETNVTEETFIQEIEKAKKCIAKVLNIDIKILMNLQTKML